MCDYSLENVASRPATVADRLVSTTFTGTFTRGFAGADDPNTAVCLRPGTEIAFEAAPRFEDPLSHSEQTASGATARFRQVNLQAPCTHQFPKSRDFALDDVTSGFGRHIARRDAGAPGRHNKLGCTAVR